MIKHIYIDMDGVLADFEGRVEMLCQKPIFKIPAKEMWAAVNKDPHFFESLEVLPGAIDLITTAYLLYAGYGTRLHILSATGTQRQDEVERQKRVWLEKHILPHFPFDQLLFMRNGGVSKRIHASRDSILIDDTHKNIVAWTESGGIGILHTSVDKTRERLKNLLQHC
jgi:5'(3')-deoxyribonucleotidase